MSHSPASRFCKSLLLLTAVSILNGQSAPPTELVTIPTAGTIGRGMYEMEILMQTNGGVLAGLEVGITDRFSLGMSYGINKFIGDEKPAINRTMPEAQVKYRLYDETYQIPAITIGLNTQGRGEFYTIERYVDNVATVIADDSLLAETIERYEIKALGFYLVGSKNWDVLGNFGSHFGISKNLLEQDSSDSDINMFFGFDKQLSPAFDVFLEFNAAFDDNEYKFTEAGIKDIKFGNGKGYLNAGVKWTVTDALYLEVDFNDILTNKGTVKYFSRELKVVFTEFF